MGKSYHWIFLIIGTMIGAGFASGRELWQFFGPKSGLAIFLFVILMAISCYSTLQISYQEKTHDYRPILAKIVGKRMSFFYDTMIIIYLFSTNVIMVAGSGATFEALNFPKWVGIFFIVNLILWVFNKGVDGILKLNSLVLPVLLIVLFGLLTLFLIKVDLMPEIATNQLKWKSAFPFTALNILPLISVLGAIGGRISSKREIIIASVVSASILGGLSFIYNYCLVLISSEISRYEMPLFGILVHFPYTVMIVVTVILWLAIFTTAIAGMMGLTVRLKSICPWSLTKLTLILLLFITPLAFIGFQVLIQYLYPLYGMINLYLLFCLLVYPLKVWYKQDKK